MKKMGMIMGASAIAMAGGATYILMNQKRRDKAEKILCKAIEEANDKISKHIN